MLSLFFSVFIPIFSFAANGPFAHPRIEPSCLQMFKTCGGLNNTYKTFTDNLVAQCEAVVRSDVCRQLIVENPEYTNSVKSCTPAEVCRERDQLFAENFLDDCKKGFLEGTGEGFVQLYDDFVKLKQGAIEMPDKIQVWAHGAWQSEKEKQKFIAQCNLNLSCKKSLVDGNPKFSKLSDADLNKYTAAALWVEHEQFQYLQSTNRRVSNKTSSLSERVQKIEKSEKLRSSTVSSQSLYSLVSVWYSKKKVELNCLDQQTRTELYCWGAAYIIDPTIVVSVASKGEKGARFVARLALEALDPKEKLKRLLPKSSHLAQSRIWQLRSAGRVSDAEAVEDFYRQQLTKGIVTYVSPQAEKSIAGQAVFVDLDNGLHGVWKKYNLYRQSGDSEIAAYLVDREMGLNMVPLTVERTVDGERGTLQMYLHDTDYAQFKDKPEAYEFFDTLIDNKDRYSRNVMSSHGQPVAIDHGLSFDHPNTPANFSPPDFVGKVQDQIDYVEIARKRYAKIEKEIKELSIQPPSEKNREYLKSSREMLAQAEKDKIKYENEARSSLAVLLPPKNVYEKMVSTSDSRWREVLKNNLTEEQINRFIDRKKQIKQAVEKAKGVMGDDIFRDGPLSPLMRK